MRVSELQRGGTVWRDVEPVIYLLLVVRHAFWPWLAIVFGEELVLAMALMRISWLIQFMHFKFVYSDISN